eukprot:GHVO01025962.1.p1 GENE.GHVO01025962.1~~GHVO01025962.1.p1  ORF type:complete len:277 (+),score=16.40 GHVO01025962.1:220-1050(+)
MAEQDRDWQGVVDSQPKLHQAVAHNDVSLVKRMVEDGCSVNEVNSWGISPLRAAVKANSLKCCQYLLNNGAEVDKPDMKAQTALFFAANSGLIDFVRLLLEAGANPDGDPHNLCSPLYSAAMHGELNILQMLISYNATLDSAVSASFASTPLYTSAVHQHWDCFEALLKAGAEPRAMRPKSSLFHTLIIRNAPHEMLQVLWECGGCVYEKDCKGRYPHQAADDPQDAALLLYYFGLPRSLLSSSRLRIRQLLGRSGLSDRSPLPLPFTLNKYIYLE